MHANLRIYSDNVSSCCVNTQRTLLCVKIVDFILESILYALHKWNNWNNMKLRAFIFFLMYLKNYFYECNTIKHNKIKFPR